MVYWSNKTNLTNKTNWTNKTNRLTPSNPLNKLCIANKVKAYKGSNAKKS